ncbi:hypothetical protein HH214_09640 [Mucilaginibacter robiniae]|uniref:Uncharacterized protein n=1 Tax=Mucilaginibacter robiniae TaxID=2728022 RepID=A0A7L5E0T2_9SPHI|nr:hypothetical protein [Mucilaginibacter robiniae]QJD96118.1 hypothetical protein HH214_09640 [Mucilaginibacter robiniae]
MKKLYFLFLAGILYGTKTHAQNTFPTNGNAAINTSVPSQHVDGSYRALWMPNGTALMPEDASSYAGISLTSNFLRTSNNAWGFVNSALPAWKLYMGHGAITDYFGISRSSSGSFNEQSLFRINSIGNIGIGTATPQSLVEIRKDASHGQGGVLEITNGGGGIGTSSEIYFSTYQRDGQNPSARIKVADDADWSGDMFFDTKGAAGSAPLYTRMYIEGSTGKVGLGTLYPNGKLDVRGPLVTGSSEGNLDPGSTNLDFLATMGQMVTGWNRSAGFGEADFIANQGAGSVGALLFTITTTVIKKLNLCGSEEMVM